MAGKNPSSFYGFFPRQETIETFIDRLEIFFAANKVIDDQEKVKFLLSSISSRTYGILKTNMSSASEELTSLSYQNVITAMTSHYTENNEMAERFLFWKRDQHPNESIMDYVNELQRLAQTCNFATFIDQSLRDRFVFGLCDKDIQKILIDTKKLTFKKACMIAQSINIKSCLTNEKLSDTGVLEKPKAALTVKRHPSTRSKSPRQSLSNRTLGINSLNNSRFRPDDVSFVVKNEPNEETMVISISPEDHGDFAFEEIICKGYPAEEADEPSNGSQAENNACGTSSSPLSISHRGEDQENMADHQDHSPSDSTHHPLLPFTCDLCQKSFGHQSNLARHRASHTGERNFKCPQCPRSYTQASSLKAHTSFHDGQRRFACDLCDRTFLYRSNLRVHVETHGAGQSFPCRLCCKDYKRRRSLRRHLVSHGEEGRKLVEEIGRQVRDRQRRERPKVVGVRRVGGLASCKECEEEVAAGDCGLHGKQHACAEKRHACRFCGLEFALVSALKRHKSEAHPGARPHACELCGVAFEHRHTLRTHHMAKHSDVRPFVCDVCGKGFVLKLKLKNHIKMHSNQRNFICETCGKGFVTNSVLKAHLQSHGDRTFVCSACDKGFKTKLALVYHTRIHTGTTTKRFTCEFCGQQFVHCVTLNSHIQKVHAVTDTRERLYKCKLCDSAFYQNSHLKSHMLVHTKERRFACHLCDRAFALRGNLVGHMVVHTGERKFRCDVCPKTFTLKRNLKSHVAKSHVGECVDSALKVGEY